MSDLYLQTSQLTSRLFTNRYSTSFSLACRFFPKDTRQAIYAIYGLTRVADEIVDTYSGKDAEHLLDDLETETLAAIKRHYSVNPLVHSFQSTVHEYAITEDLIKPFFASMRSDLQPRSYNQARYERYIHGSAEVVGLMCLKVFCAGDQTDYERLAAGAAKLGAAYQKINFLRDLCADYELLGRYYFPIGTYQSFDDSMKEKVIHDIQADLAIAVPAMNALPRSAKRAVRASFRYSNALLNKLSRASASTIKTKRLRIANSHKLLLLLGPEPWSRR